MKYRKLNVPSNTQSRDMVRLSQDTGNVYESVMIIAKRANEIAQQQKSELLEELAPFNIISESGQDTSTINEEQIEVSRRFEREPKPVLIATAEYEDHRLNHFSPMRLRDKK